MIHYRTFRNADPPGLVQVWNAAFPAGAPWPTCKGAMWLEYFLFSKPYFDPDGLIARDVGELWVFRPAGFGPNDTESALNPEKRSPLSARRSAAI